jgi:hypothetical protein
MRRTAAIGYPRERDLVEDCRTERSVAELPQCGKNRRRAGPLPTPCRVTFWIVSRSSHIACLRAHDARECIINRRGGALDTP